jgi:predicted nuclease of predicted toxin-antitoxin system
LAIWQWAKKNAFTIVTNDADFQDFVVLYGYPPKVLLLRVGNQSTAFLCQLLIEKQAVIAAFMADEESGILEIY